MYLPLSPPFCFHPNAQTDLVEELGFTIDQALAAFAAARPPGVKHQHFIDALRARYGGGDCDASPTTSTSAGSSTHIASSGGSGGSGGRAEGSSKGDDAATCIIPPAEECEPARAASVGEEGNDASMIGGLAINNETLVSTAEVGFE